VPAHEDAGSPLEAAVRNLLSICCLSETVAVSLIGAERLEMPSGELRDLLTGIYSDEVGHSRFGWRQLGTLPPSLRPKARSSGCAAAVTRGVSSSTPSSTSSCRPSSTTACPPAGPGSQRAGRGRRTSRPDAFFAPAAAGVCCAR